MDRSAADAILTNCGERSGQHTPPTRVCIRSAQSGKLRCVVMAWPADPMTGLPLAGKKDPAGGDLGWIIAGNLHLCYDHVKLRAHVMQSHMNVEDGFAGGLDVPHVVGRADHATLLSNDLWRLTVSPPPPPQPSWPSPPYPPSLPEPPPLPQPPPLPMWVSQEALAEAGKCIAQNMGRQPVQSNAFVCVSGAGGAGDISSCAFVAWPLDPLSGTPLLVSPGEGESGIKILSVVGDACYAADTLAVWVKENARGQGIPLALASVPLPITGAWVLSRLLHRAAVLGGEVTLSALQKPQGP